jgi:hypothetical protein
MKDISENFNWKMRENGRENLDFTMFSLEFSSEGRLNWQWGRFEFFWNILFSFPSFFLHNDEGFSTTNENNIEYLNFIWKGYFLGLGYFRFNGFYRKFWMWILARIWSSNCVSRKLSNFFKLSKIFLSKCQKFHFHFVKIFQLKLKFSQE